MIEFFRDMTESTLLQSGLIAGLLTSVACGLTGPYVVARRIAFLSGAIAHTTVCGVGAAIFFRHLSPDALGWLTPLQGAVVAAIVSAVIIGVVYEKVQERMDTLIGAMWAVGMALGLMFARYTPGYNTELMSYLFGNIAVVSQSDLYWLGAMVAVIVVTVALTHKRLLALCLDEEFAALQGTSVLGSHLLLLILVALTVVTLTQVVGLILVIALLTLPAATAAHHVLRLGPLMIFSTILCMLLTTLPRAAVYGTRLAPEQAIVIAAAGVYLISVIFVRVKRRIAAKRAAGAAVAAA